MLSIIVPVYNTENELNQCLESIVRQTYSEITVILIDDGSTDSCGELCDRWAEKDPRIRVFHTENRGLSEARNLGLAKAREIGSEYVMFVDSDDWIDENMAEAMMGTISSGENDVVCCGAIHEFLKKSVVYQVTKTSYSGYDAVKAIVKGDNNNFSGGKLYRIRLFDGIAYPAGQYYEDVLTICQVIRSARQVVCVDNCFYHYRQRARSIVHSTSSLKVLLDCWKAYHDRWQYLVDNGFQDDTETIEAALYWCAIVIGRFWRYYYSCEERNPEAVKEMNLFVKEHFGLFGEKGWSSKWRFCIFMAHSTSRFSFWLCGMINNLYSLISFQNAKLY